MKQVQGDGQKYVIPQNLFLNLTKEYFNQNIIFTHYF